MTKGALPNVVIIGAMKCATTSLHFYLDRHPEIGMSREKELNFFSRDDKWALGEAWYRQWFDPNQQIRGEASPSYSTHPSLPGVAGRMHGLIPDARLIYLVRDPLARTLAHYRHNVAERREDRSVDVAVADEASTYVSRSLYHFQLEEYLRFFPLERILVLQQELLLGDREATLARVFSWLGVDPSFRSIWFARRRHLTRRKRRLTDLGFSLSRSLPLRAISRLPDPLRWMIEDPVLWPFSRSVPQPVVSPELTAVIRERFRVDVERLRGLTGQLFEGWSV